MVVRASSLLRAARIRAIAACNGSGTPPSPSGTIEHKSGSLSALHLHHRDSRAGLLEFATSNALPPDSVFFYLNAHGFGDLPVTDEIKLAFRYWPDAVVMVDDFAVPDDPRYGFDDYGAGKALTLEYLIDNDVLCARLPRLARPNNVPRRR